MNDERMMKLLHYVEEQATRLDQPASLVFFFFTAILFLPLPAWRFHKKGLDDTPKTIQQFP